MWDVKLRFSLMITPSTLFSLTLVSGFASVVTGISGGGGAFFCHRKPCTLFRICSGKSATWSTMSED